MPKLTIKTPKMCRDRKQAYSQHKGKRYYHGVWGTPEALQKYKRFIAALMENPHLPQPDSKIGEPTGIGTRRRFSGLRGAATGQNRF